MSTFFQTTLGVIAGTLIGVLIVVAVRLIISLAYLPVMGWLASRAARKNL